MIDEKNEKKEGFVLIEDKTNETEPILIDGKSEFNSPFDDTLNKDVSNSDGIPQSGFKLFDDDTDKKKQEPKKRRASGRKTKAEKERDAKVIANQIALVNGVSAMYMILGKILKGGEMSDHVLNEQESNALFSAYKGVAEIMADSEPNPYVLAIAGTASILGAKFFFD